VPLLKDKIAFVTGGSGGIGIAWHAGFDRVRFEEFGSDLPVAGAGLAEVVTGFQQAGLVRA
jgi:hypothetical protein